MSLGPNPAIGRDIGGYRVETELGRGGMGVVYRATDLRLRRKVALKVLPPEYGDDGTFRARFLRESRIAASIDHPGVIPVYEAGDAEGELFIAMRYVDGTDLSRLLREEAPLDPERALDLVGQLAAALDAAHAAGLVHRDVKPSNALVARNGAAEHVYLSDFGLSKETATGDATLSISGGFVGTVRYTAPEVIRGEDADARADLYSLGCVLFECLTGEPPFTGPGDPAVIYGHLEQPPPRPSALRPGLPHALDAVLARALEKDPQRRYTSGAQLVQAARAALGGRRPRGARAVAPPLPHPSRRLLLGAAAALLVAAAALLLAESDEQPQLADVRADGVAIIDVEEGSLVRQVSLEGGPTAMADGHGAVWVSDAEDDVVARIDKATSTIRQTIEVSHGPAALAVTDEAVWVANRDDGTVSVISPQSNQVVDTIRVGRTVDGMCSGGGQVWVASPLDHAVVRYDPRSARRAGVVRMDGQPAGLACGDGAVWATSPGSGTVTEISTAAATPVRTVGVSIGVSAIAVGPSGVWVANPLDGTVARIDPGRGTVTGTIALGASDGPAHLAVTEDAVWVSSEFGGAVSRVDPGRAAVEDRLLVGSRPQGLAVVDGALWVGVADTGTRHRGGTLRLEYALEAGSADDLPFELRSLTEDGLTGFRRQGSSAVATVVADLAESLPTPTDGGRTYAFRLREGLVYSDGEPVLASDVRHGIEQGVMTYGQNLFTAVRGGEQCTRKRCDLSRGIVTDDDARTLVFRLARPDPDLLSKLALPLASAYPSHSDEQRRPATGPYVLAEFRRGVVRYERNPRFKSWSAVARPDGFPDEIVVRAGVTDRRRSVERVLDGNVDRINGFYDVNIPLDQARAARRRAPAQVRTSIAPATTFFLFDTRRPPFDDVDVRRAVSFAFDRRAAARAYGGNEAAAATCQVLPPNFAGHRPYCPFTIAGSGGAEGRPDLARARQLVRRSGTAGMTVTVQWPALLQRRVPSVMIRALRRLGYAVRPRPLSPNRHFAVMHSEPPQVGFYPWLSDFPAPATFFQLFSCETPPEENPSRFCDPGVDRLAAQAARLQTIDPSASDAMWARAERRLVDQAPGIAMFNPLNTDVLSERVGNYRLVPLLGMLLDQAWVR